VVFGEAIRRGDFAAAYASTAAAFRRRVSLEAFRVPFLEVEARIGRPVTVKCERGVFEDLPTTSLWKDLQSQGVEVPAPSAFVDWLAIGFKCALGAYDCWVLVVAEGNEERVGHLEIHPP
jgi:hypothetical protein